MDLLVALRARNISVIIPPAGVVAGIVFPYVVGRVLQHGTAVAADGLLDHTGMGLGIDYFDSHGYSRKGISSMHHAVSSYMFIISLI